MGLDSLLQEMKIALQALKVHSKPRDLRNSLLKGCG